MSTSRRRPTMVRGRDVAEKTDNLLVNLRQTKRKLTIRDQEVRSLRAAVIHLENALSRRERDFHDTVLRLQGESPLSPRQGCLHKGAPTSKLRLQVHRLQRAVAAKQDHIDHLNRQASLGFLREAREQAEEYRAEANRLSRTLEAVSRSNGSTSLYTAIGTDLGLFRTPAANVSIPGQKHRIKAYEAPEGHILTEERHPRWSGSPLSFPVTQLQPETSCTWPTSGGEVARGTMSSRNGGDMALQTNVTEAQFECPNTSTLANQVGIGRTHGSAAAQDSNKAPPPPSSTHSRRPCTGARRRSSRALGIRRPYSADLTGVASRSLPIKTPDRVGHSAGTYIPAGPSSSQGSRRFAERCWDCQRKVNFSKLAGIFSDEIRTKRMAERARLRFYARQTAAERTQGLALEAESLRLRATRARRARKTRLMQEKIARYRQMRVSELDARLHRSADRKGQNLTHTQVAIDAGNGNFNNTVQKEDATAENGGSPHLSNPRRALQAAIAAADVVSATEHRESSAAANTPHSPKVPINREGENNEIPCPVGSGPSKSFTEVLGGGDGSDRVGIQRGFANPQGRPPLPPLRTNRSTTCGRKSTGWKEGTLDSRAFGRGDDGYRNPGEVNGSTFHVGTAWDDDKSDADEVSTEVASNDSGAGVEELWGDEEDGNDAWHENGFDPRSWEWGNKSPRTEYSQFVREGSPRSNYTSARKNGDGADWQKAESMTSPRIEGEDGLGVDRRVALSFPNDLLSCRDDGGTVELHSPNFGRIKGGPSPQGIPPWRDEVYIYQYWTRSREADSSRLSNGVRPGRIESFPTLDNEPSSPDSKQKIDGRVNSEIENQHTSRTTSVRRTIQIEISTQEAPSDANPVGSGRRIGEMATRDVELANRNSFESNSRGEAMDNAATDSKILRYGEVSEEGGFVQDETCDERQVMVGERFDGDAWGGGVEAVAAPGEEFNGNRFGKDSLQQQQNEGDSYNSDWSLSVEESTKEWDHAAERFETANKEAEERKKRGGSMRAGEMFSGTFSKKGELVGDLELDEEMPEYQNDFAENMDKRSTGASEDRLVTPENQGGSFFAISPPSDEETEAFQDSATDAGIDAPPNRIPISRIDPLRASGAGLSEGESPFPISCEIPVGEFSWRKRPRRPESTSERLSQRRPMSSLTPRHTLEVPNSVDGGCSETESVAERNDYSSTQQNKGFESLATFASLHSGGNRLCLGDHSSPLPVAGNNSARTEARESNSNASTKNGSLGGGSSGKASQSGPLLPKTSPAGGRPALPNGRSSASPAMETSMSPTADSAKNGADRSQGHKVTNTAASKEMEAGGALDTRRWDGSRPSTGVLSDTLLGVEYLPALAASTVDSNVRSSANERTMGDVDMKCNLESPSPTLTLFHVGQPFLANDGGIKLGAPGTENTTSLVDVEVPGNGKEVEDIAGGGTKCEVKSALSFSRVPSGGDCSVLSGAVENSQTEKGPSVATTSAGFERNQNVGENTEITIESALFSVSMPSDYAGPSVSGRSSTSIEVEREREKDDSKSLNGGGGENARNVLKDDGRFDRDSGDEHSLTGQLVSSSLDGSELVAGSGHGTGDDEDGYF